MLRRVGFAVVLLVVAGVGLLAEKAPLNVAIVWHQHQPMYWNRLTEEYELPWVRIHGVQEYIDSARISAEVPDVLVTFNLQPSLLWQLADYATITERETDLGGLYDHIGAADNHLKWTWTLANDPSALLAEERALAEEQFFWLNGYMLDQDGDDPYYDAYYAELNARADDVGLTDGELLDAAGLFLLWQTSPELHEAYGLLDLREHRGFTRDDIIHLIEAQMSILQDVVAAYEAIVPLGNELITSPFYHPILPLLVENGWSEDVLGQIEAGQAQHEQLFGNRAIGIWSPEQAVSEDSVRLLGQAGLRWTSTDEGILARSLSHTPSTAELTTPYMWDGVTIFFRETELSDKISFAYGNKETDAAVDDFLGELEAIWDALEDPSGHVLTLAMDGENWMFMAGYPNNGRTFLRALYAALEQTEWVRVVTPAQLIAEGIPTTDLATLPTGSWAGDLSTWSGEADEDEAWDRLAAARRTVAAAGDPSGALEAIYAAEGSDWFWWYGTDQDSGTDDLYDWLFKAHLTAAYRRTDAGAEIPEVLSLRLIVPVPVSLGEVSPQVDGAISADEDWTDAAFLAGTDVIEDVLLGYVESRLYLRLTTGTDARDWIGRDAYLMVYLSGATGDPSNVATRYAESQIGFPVAYAVQLPLAKLRNDGSGTAVVYAADGAGGWRSASSLATLVHRRAFAGEVFELSVPFSELGIEPGKSRTVLVAVEDGQSILGQAAEIPILAAVPTLIQGVEICEIVDPTGDDVGTGSYVYPTDSVFAVEGLFDLERYAIYDADDRWQLAFDFAALPNPWNGPQGFSHPILFLYFDIQEGGSVESHEEAEAARVRFDPEGAWDVFAKVAGWPAYGRHLWTAANEGPFLIEVASDPKRGRIIVTIPKQLLPAVDGWHYVLVASQDGYGDNHVRPVGETAGIWTGGGSPDPVWAPQVYDYLAPASSSQEEILASYVPGSDYASLIPVSIESK